MTDNTNTAYRNRFTAFLFGTRIIISKGTGTIANLPILAGILAALCAIRLTVFAVIIALLLGYRFSIQKNTSESFDAAVQDAAEKVKTAVKDATDEVKNSVANASAQVKGAVENASAQMKDAVENVKQEIKTGIESWDGVEDHH